MGFQDLPFLPLTMRGRSRDGRQFPSHEEVPRISSHLHVHRPIVMATYCEQSASDCKHSAPRNIPTAIMLLTGVQLPQGLCRHVPAGAACPVSDAGRAGRPCCCITRTCARGASTAQ